MKTLVQTIIVMGVAIAVGVMLFVHAPMASADDKAVNTLKVSPVRTDIDIKPGETRTIDTIVTNLTDEDITVRPVENDFIAGDESGTPALILDEDRFAPTHSLKRFMKPLADVVIPARESKTISVTISVPEDASAGGYFGAVRFAPTTGETGGQVNLTASVASLMLVRVPGDIVEKLTMTEFAIQQNGVTGKRFSSPNGLTATVRFENQGNVQVGPFGKVSIKKGDTVVKELDFNNKEQRDVVLPDSARRWNIPLEGIDKFGKYTVSATFTYGENNQTVQAEQTFWVIPLGLVLSVVGGILALVAIVLGVRFGLNRYKQQIIKQHDSINKVNK